VSGPGKENGLGRIAWSGSKLMNVAHRGARAFAPENTLEAFEKALRVGADGVELDVQCSKDDELVVVHDDDVQRCTDARERFAGRAMEVCSLTLAEMKSLDAGTWFGSELIKPPAERARFLRGLTIDEQRQWISPGELAHLTSGKVRIPTLNEALALVRDLGLWVNVEIKNLPRRYPRIAERVMRCLEEMGLMERAWVSSFDHRVLVEARRASARVATGVLSSDRLVDPLRYLRELDADAFHPGCAGDCDSLGLSSVDGRIDVETIAALRRAGCAVIAWTVNDPLQMKRLEEAGVSGVITDFPNRMTML